jgi:2-oxoglutarate dehydrogenase complex dehydrogenase (E1) component-like enzyme
MVDAQAMHKQVLVLRLISKFRTLGMLHADSDGLVELSEEQRGRSS